MRGGDNKFGLGLAVEAASGSVKHRELNIKSIKRRTRKESSFSQVHTGCEDEGQEREGVKNVAHSSVCSSLKS